MTTTHLTTSLSGADMVTLIMGALVFCALAAYVVVTGHWVVQEMSRVSPRRPR